MYSLDGGLIYIRRKHNEGGVQVCFIKQRNYVSSCLSSYGRECRSVQPDFHHCKNR